jgi:hypothetical protein
MEQKHDFYAKQSDPSQSTKTFFGNCISWLFNKENSSIFQHQSVLNQITVPDQGLLLVMQQLTLGKQVLFLQTLLV